MHVARGDGYREDAAGMTRIGDIHRVLGKDDRIVVGERDALAAGTLSCVSDLVGPREVHQPVHVARLGNVPVLAELARQVAAGGAEGQHARAGKKMVQRLFFDRIEAESRRSAIGGEYHAVVETLAHETGAALAFMQPAVAWTQIALQPAVPEHMPPASGIRRIGCGHVVSGSAHLATV